MTLIRCPLKLRHFPLAVLYEGLRLPLRDNGADVGGEGTRNEAKLWGSLFSDSEAIVVQSTRLSRWCQTDIVLPCECERGAGACVMFRCGGGSVINEMVVKLNYKFGLPPRELSGTGSKPSEVALT